MDIRFTSVNGFFGLAPPESLEEPSCWFNPETGKLAYSVRSQEGELLWLDSKEKSFSFPGKVDKDGFFSAKVEIPDLDGGLGHLVRTMIAGSLSHLYPWACSLSVEPYKILRQEEVMEVRHWVGSVKGSRCRLEVIVREIIAVPKT